MVVNCPICNSIDIGKVGTGQFYCWNCLMEFSVTAKGFTAYYVDEEGTLISLSDMAQDSVVLEENLLG